MWITQLQAAEILGVHKQTVAKMVARGELSSRGQAPGVRWTVTRCWLWGLLAGRLRIGCSVSGRLELAGVIVPSSRPTRSTSGYGLVGRPSSWA